MGSISRVRVLNVSHVLPAATGSPQPLPDDGLIRLSFVDCFFLGATPMQRLFFYEGGPSVPPFPCLVRSLQSSLAAALATFVPLAGKLTYRPSAGDLVVDCSPDAVAPGVRFVEAEFAGTMVDLHRLAAGGDDTETLARLGPELLDAGAARRLPAPVFAVQVTRPSAAGDGGGVVVGVCIHHAVADGCSVWQFMRAWSSAASSSSFGDDGMRRLVPAPSFDRAAVWHPKAEELARRFLRTIAPALPMVKPSSSFAAANKRRRTFMLRADQIQSVKQLILAQSEAIGEPLEKHPSTFVAVTSLVWTSIVRAKKKTRVDHAADDDDACYYFVLPVDCRRRRGLGQPSPSAVGRQGYFGNCLALRLAKAAATDLVCAEAGLARAAAAIGEAVVRATVEEDDDPMRDAEGWPELCRVERVTTHAGSSNRFMAYETDFGWGAPTRVELVSMSAKEKMLLLGAPDGGVQVTVALDHAHMEGFAANFLKQV